MTDANSNGPLRRVVTCSVCLERCHDPEIRLCGHSFCQACINQPWRNMMEKTSCPWCKGDFLEAKFGSDNLPCKMGETEEQFLFEGPSSWPENMCAWPENMCANHKQDLTLFCVEDQTFICIACRDSGNHKSHTVLTREEAEASINQEVRHALTGWEKFPEPKPASITGDIHLVELVKKAEESDLAGLKDDPSFSKIQTFMAWMVVLIFLIAMGGLSATIFVFTRAAIRPAGIDLKTSTPLCCPENWISSRENCYYFSEDEGNWKSAQNYCSSHAASLAVFSSLEALNTAKQHKGIANHWVGLQREPGQPWRWVDGTAFNHLFEVSGAGLCAYLDGSVVNNAGCDTTRKWVCSKPNGQAGEMQRESTC